MSQTGLTGIRRRLGSMKLHERVAGYLLSMPGVLTLLAFVVVPIIASFVFTFMKYDLLRPPVWKGLGNLRRLLGDTRLWSCYRNTLLISIGSVAGTNFLGLLLAMGVNRKMHKALSYFLRTTLFFPVLTTTSSMALVWLFILTKDRGVLNWALSQIGIAPVPWLSSKVWGIRSIVMYDVWKNCGSLMLLYLAGLQGIPEVMYEAAKIDGAGPWQLTRHITLPLLTPTAFFGIVMGIIAALQMFDQPYVLTGGGPGDATRTVSMYIYEVAFKRFEMGYGSAVAVSLLVLLVVLTLAQFLIGRKWVFYG